MNHADDDRSAIFEMKPMNNVQAPNFMSRDGQPTVNGKRKKKEEVEGYASSSVEPK